MDGYGYIMGYVWKLVIIVELRMCWRIVYAWWCFVILNWTGSRSLECMRLVILIKQLYGGAKLIMFGFYYCLCSYLINEMMYQDDGLG